MPVCHQNISTFLRAGLPQSGKLPVLNLLRGWKSAFLPCRGDSLHWFTWNLQCPRGTWVHLAVQNFTSVGARGVGTCPQNLKISGFGKELSHRGEPLDRFLQMSGASMHTTILQKCFKFDTSHLTDYGIIAEKCASVIYPEFFRAPCRNKKLSWCWQTHATHLEVSQGHQT